MARVLCEERKHSLPLALNLLECFWCFSSVSQLHPVLTANKVGNATLNALEFELRRRAHHVSEPVTTQEERLQRALYLSRAERLCYICVYILYNISEDLAIEQRIRQRRVQPMLVTILAQFENPDTTTLMPLKLLCALFLKKLSAVRTNVIELLEVGHMLAFNSLCFSYFALASLILCSPLFTAQLHPRVPAVLPPPLPCAPHRPRLHSPQRHLQHELPPPCPRTGGAPHHACGCRHADVRVCSALCLSVHLIT